MKHHSSLLIEASAGTGKTWTIERRVLALVARQQSPLSLRQILLVTFTDAATLELRERIRAILVKVLANNEQSLAILAEAGLIFASQDELAVMLSRLKTQLQDFSSTPIFTIHGFCTLILARYAMELGLPSRQVIDNRYRQTASKDFLRETLVSSETWQLGGLVFETDARKLAIRNLLTVFGNAQTHPGADDFADVLAQIGLQGILDVSLYAYPWDELKELWLDVFVPHAASILAHQSDQLEVESVEIHAFFDDFHSQTRQLGKLSLNDQFRGKRDQGFGKIVAANLLKFAAKTSAFVLAKCLHDSFEHWLLSRKELAGTFNFDDLIKKLANLLNLKQGQNLLSNLRHDYRAILIDEFQDTDPRQWSIFSKFLNHSSLTAVGDPKQAIYAFRGADIGTYFNSRASFDQQSSLDSNYRSNPAMLEHLNRLASRWFTLAASRYDSPSSTYCELTSGLVADEVAVLRDASGNVLPCFGVLPLSVDGHMQANNADDGLPVLRQRAYKNCVKSIAGLVKSAYLGISAQSMRKVEANDIAILVESYKDAYRLRDNLQEAGISASIQGRGDLRSCQEADELLLFCRALQDPSDASAVRAFLLTRLGGLRQEDLLAYCQGPSYTSLAAQLQVWKSEVPKSGFLAVFAQLQRGQHLSALYDDTLACDLWRRLFTCYGDRALRSYANYQHLADLLQNHCDEQAGDGQRIAWIFADLLESMSLGEQSPLRRERQDGAVRIMTQHSAKGLEFEIVYAMIGLAATKDLGSWNSWEDSHGDKTVRSLAPKLGYSDSHLEAKVWNNKALEKLRLYYVAITRAKSGLIVPYLAQVTLKNKAPMWLHEWCQAQPGQHRQSALLYQDPALFNANDDLVAFSVQAFELDAIQRPDSQAQTQNATQTLVAANQIELPPACRLRDADLRAEELCSFTSLQKRRLGFAQGSWDPSLKDHDAPVQSELAQPNQLPRGTAFGTLFHELVAAMDLDLFLQAWDHDQSFLKADPSIAQVLARQLTASGLGTHAALRLNDGPIRSHILCQMLYGALNAEQLGLVKSKKRLCELEFMARIDQAQRPAMLDNVELSEGFLTGSIDMVYQSEDGAWNIIDWKTNFLTGDAQEMQNECQTIMQHSNYHMQGLIYQSILKLLLEAEGKEAKLGSVYYVFVRGSLSCSDSRAWIVDLGQQLQAKVEQFIAQTGLKLASN